MTFSETLHLLLVSRKFGKVSVSASSRTDELMSWDLSWFRFYSLQINVLTNAPNVG